MTMHAKIEVATVSDYKIECTTTALGNSLNQRKYTRYDHFDEICCPVTTLLKFSIYFYCHVVAYFVA